MRKWRSRFAESGPGGLADVARPGRPKAGLVLPGAEHDQLTRQARRAKTTQVPASRAKIVQACAEGKDSKRVAAIGGFVAWAADGLPTCPPESAGSAARAC